MALARIQVRRDTTAGWGSANPILAAGEPGFDTTLKQLRIGDGATPWTGLPPATVDQATLAQLIAAADALEDAVTPTDAVMAAAAANTSSAFRGALDSTYVTFKNFNGTPVVGKNVVITLTEDGTDIHDITVEEL